MFDTQSLKFAYQSLIYYLVLSSIYSQCYRLSSRVTHSYFSPNEIPTSTHKSYAPSLQNINIDNKDDSKDHKNFIKEHKITNTVLPSEEDVTSESSIEVTTDLITDNVLIETTTSLNRHLSVTEDNLMEKKWNLVWRDDFDGESGTLPSNDNWIFDIGTSYPGGPANWGNREAQYYTNHPNNVCVDGKGNLKITPIRDENGNWTSARIETTRTNFKAPKGGMLAIEGRIQMPNVTGDAATGYWPAFWALGSPLRGHYHNWPQIGELDIMENVNGLNSVWGVLHCGLAPNDPCKETNGLGKRHPCPNDSCQTSFHTYRFEWDETQNPTEMRWYVDGVQYHNVTSDVIDDASWNSMTSHDGYFILLNVAIGGAFPNALAGFKDTPTDLTESGHPMLIDYVAVYDSIN